MFDPIVLTKTGATLINKDDSQGELTDDSEFPKASIIGIHKKCLGYPEIYPDSETHNAIYCHRCGLRIVYPNTVKTYGQLRKYLASFLKPSWFKRIFCFFC